MKINKKVQSIVSDPIFTEEGAPASKISKLFQLRRSVMATMLWEDNFYEDGVSVTERIEALIKCVAPGKVAQLAVEARTKGKLRHIPLWIARVMARLPTHKSRVADVLGEIIQRPDELSEFLAIYWKDKKEPLSAQVKKGLAKAFTKFDEYQLAKYNRDNEIKLRDVLFLCHAKPKDKEQEGLWKRLIDDKLKTPDTWEVALSATEGVNKKEQWERLLKENKLGGLALLRNLNNFKEAKVDETLIRQAIKAMRTERILPYRFITASKYAPNFEPELEEAMYKAIGNKEVKLKGRTILLLDVSGSMEQKISAKSDSSRLDAASGLAVLARELCEEVEVFTFSSCVEQVPSRRGFALRDAIVKSQPHQSTELGKAITALSSRHQDRMIIFTDEQSHDKVGDPRKNSIGYVVNVANNKHGVGYGKWNHIDGFSEAILDYIVELESLSED